MTMQQPKLLTDLDTNSYGFARFITNALSVFVAGLEMLRYTVSGAAVQAISFFAPLADMAVQYVVPVTTNTVTALNNTSTLLINPAGTLAALTIVHPKGQVDGQIFTVASSQILTAVTHNAAAGDTLKGALTTVAAADGFAKWQYKLSNTTWFRIG